MRIIFTGFVTRHCSPELRDAYWRTTEQVTRVARSFEHLADKRALVVVLACPCCRDTPTLRMEDGVLVSPLHNIVATGFKIAVTDKYPPHRTPRGEDEAASDDGFLTAFHRTIERALTDMRTE